MKNILPILLVFVGGLNLMGQDRSKTREGKISYVTSQSVYVKFSSMDNISAGDTLYTKQDDYYVPALQIKNLSSISCVCVPLVQNEFKVSEAVFVIFEARGIPGETLEDEEILPVPVQVNTIADGDTLPLESSSPDQWKQEIHGRISVSSYSNLSNSSSPRRQRMRYTFSMDANNLGNTGFSVESYISFAHSNTNWQDIKSNIFNGLKIYGLSAKYEFKKTMYLSVGRKVNPMLSSVGAVDGFQFEKKFNSFTLGAIAGSRPDYADYSLNMDLLQYGVYLGHELKKQKISMQNSLAFVEQTNRSKTDRRFIYYQHSSWLTKSLSLFGSAEMDLYKKVHDTIENTYTLSNLYLSLRYRIIPQLSLGLSYSSRQTVIYFETYKDYVERLLDNEALQGWRFRINARPIKYLYLGASAGYRYRKEDPNPSRNVYVYATYSHFPWIKASITLSSTFLQTGYFNGNIYSIGLSRDIFPGKLNAGIKYRYVDYLYLKSETYLEQNVFEANISWNVYRKLSLSVYFEGTFEKEHNYNRLYLNLTQRF